VPPALPSSLGRAGSVGRLTRCSPVLRGSGMWRVMHGGAHRLRESSSTDRSEFVPPTRRRLTKRLTTARLGLGSMALTRRLGQSV
jgi:hypothetical protein